MFKLNTIFLAVFMLLFNACSNSEIASAKDQAVVNKTQESIPNSTQLKIAVDEAYSKFKRLNAGKNADYISYLAKVKSSLFGVVIATASGEIYTAGDVNFPFSIQSVSKVFTLALALQQHGEMEVFSKIGVEPTGMPFNSGIALELLKNSTNRNPVGNGLVNAGAIATVSLVKAANPDAKFNLILSNLSNFAGEQLSLNKEVYQSEASDNYGNKGLAERLKNYGFLYDEPISTVDVYTKQCSINVTAKQLAIMGATLANHGINPITKKRVLDAKYVPKVLAVMMMAGFYDEAGKWAYNTGIPAKTGVGGGIVAIVPGKYAIVGFSPPLDSAGNSVRAAEAIHYIVEKFHANLFGN